MEIFLNSDFISIWAKAFTIPWIFFITNIYFPKVDKNSGTSSSARWHFFSCFFVIYNLFFNLNPFSRDSKCWNGKFMLFENSIDHLFLITLYVMNMYIISFAIRPWGSSKFEFLVISNHHHPPFKEFFLISMGFDGCFASSIWLCQVHQSQRLQPVSLLSPQTSSSFFSDVSQ